MDRQEETAAASLGSSPVDGRRDAVLEDLREVVSSIDDVTVLQEFGAQITGVVEAKKQRIEQEDWDLLEGLALKHGHQSVASWMARRGIALPSAVKSPSRRKRDFSEVPFWVHPLFGSYSIKLGKRPSWVKEYLSKGYTEEQLSAAKGTYSDTKGVAFWLDVTTGEYWLNTRPSIPTRIASLLEADETLTLADLSRPPHSFPQESGRCALSDLPPKINIPEPAGKSQEEGD